MEISCSATNPSSTSMWGGAGLCVGRSDTSCKRVKTVSVSSETLWLSDNFVDAKGYFSF